MTKIDPTTVPAISDAFRAAGWTPPPAAAEPAESEAAKIARIANELPEGVVPSTMLPVAFEISGFVRFNHACWTAPFARTLLIGWMAEYVGGEPGAYVCRCSANFFYRYMGTQQQAPDLLSAYATCCAAIAKRRKEGGK